jgi:aryl-alcohol dehydrogenase-like predicted oxidoreductase
MEIRLLGRTGLKITEFCLGAMIFGREIDEASARTILDRYVEAGGNFVDTADVYGGGASEKIVGRWLQGRRDLIVLATKVRLAVSPNPNDVGASRRHIRAGVEASLRRLQTDWIDLYQLHCWDATTPLEETLSTLDDLVREGKVRYVGASNYTAWQLMKALGVGARHGWEPFVSLQPQYSLAVRDIERELLPLCRSEGLAVLPWSPLAGGLLSGKYKRGQETPEGTRARDTTPSAFHLRQRLEQERTLVIADAVSKIAADEGRSPAQVALNWVRSRPGVTAPILGVRTLAQLDDDLACLEWRLDDAQIAALEEATGFERGYPYDFIDWIHAGAISKPPATR